MSTYDTIILGSSPNALTAACYLARDGKKVLVLEQLEQIGGAFVTTQSPDGFRGDVGLTSGRIDAAIFKDLKLGEHGLEVIERDTITSLLPDGKSFSLPVDRDAATKVISKFSEKDAAKYKPFMQLVDLASDFLKSAYEMTAPGNHPPSPADVQQLTLLTGKLKGYGKREMTEVMRLLVMSVRDLLDEWFESDQLKGLLGATAVRGINQGPFAGSTTYNFLHHIAQGDGFFRATAKGGVGAISMALSNAAKSYGAEIRTGVGSFEVNVENGIATGVNVSGKLIEAKTIISDYDARYTFTKLVAPPELEPEFNRAVRNTRYGGAVTRINVALSKLPEFPGVTEEALRGTLSIAPSVSYLEEAFDGGKHGGISAQPFIEITIPTLSDHGQAPANKHVMSIWMQYTPYRSTFTSEDALKLALEQLSKYSPNLKSLVEHSQVLTPKDLESQFLLTEGHLYGGEVNLAQAFFLRPIPGYAQYNTPISQLYLCGAATHPGGMNGLSGRNTARELGVRDMVPA